MPEENDHIGQTESSGHRDRPILRLLRSWTMVLVVTYLAVFIFQYYITPRFYPAHSYIFSYLALSREGIAHGYLWQLLTYQFMHAGWMHLIFNCWAILVFGSELEYLLGARRFLALTFSSGIVGGVFQILTSVLWPTLFGGWVVGASACAFGLVAAFATIFPEQELMILVIFIPVRLQAMTLLIVSVVIAMMGIIFPMANFPLGHIANAAHLGGMAMGWFYVKKIMKNPALPLPANS